MSPACGNATLTNGSGHFGHLCVFSPLRRLGSSNNSSRAVCGLNESDHHMHSVIELRRAKRYQLSAPTLFMWAPQDGEPQSGQGVTRDINAFGVYVLTKGLPPAGALVQMEIVLPKLADNGPGMHLTGEGVVLRVDCRGTKANGTTECGFDASVHFYPEPTESVLSRLKIPGQIG